MESDEMIPIEIKYEGEDVDLEDELDEVAELPRPKKAKTKSKNKTNNKDNKRRRTSYVWSFFELLPTKDEEKPTCKCKKCGKEYIVAGAYGTGNLKRHLDAIFSYLCVDVPNISRNIAKNDLVKIVLNFCHMPPPHNGVSLFEKVYKLLSMWGIENKIFCVTLDNASSNDVSIDMLRTQLINKKALVCNGEFFHLHCCAHILNLVVQDGLKEIDVVVQKIRESIKYVRGSQERKKGFYESVKQMDFAGKKGLRQDVPTRWNSTFLMLQSALYYRRAFQHLELTDYNFKHCPTVDKWKKVEKIKNFLVVFYDATLVFSGTKYPIANLYFPQVFIVYFTLKKESDSEDEYMRKIADQMLVKFEKYWIEFSVVLVIAVVLDPRYMLSFIDWCYQKLYGYASSLQYLKVREKLFVLLGEYVSNVPTPSTFSGMAGQATQETEEQYANKGSLSMMKEFDSFHSMDVELAAMARDILSIPISTVASESTFSVGGQVIDQFRSALKLDVVEALVCRRDWLYADIGVFFIYMLAE
nr:zinc finger BED domain-containing protein RICESLEEPER 2-like [Quercus suber]